MSNTRHIDLAKLAAVMRGQLPARLRPTPTAARRPATSFPRVDLERVEELLLGAELDDRAAKVTAQVSELLPGGLTFHYRQADVMDPTTLRQRHRAAVGRYYRALVDLDGEVPAGLLAELGDIADEHAQPDDIAVRASSHRTRTRSRAGDPEAA